MTYIFPFQFLKKLVIFWFKDKLLHGSCPGDNAPDDETLPRESGLFKIAKKHACFIEDIEK